MMLGRGGGGVTVVREELDTSSETMATKYFYLKLDYNMCYHKVQFEVYCM